MTAGLTNYVFYQIGWLLCVGAVGRGFPVWGAAAAVTFTVVHACLSRRPSDEATLASAALLVGAFADTALVRSGALSFPWGMVFDGFTTPWMLALWAQFATTLRFSFRWMTGRYQWAALAGALGGPLAFRAGEALGAVALGVPRWRSFAAVSVVWSLALPILVALSARGSEREGAGEYRFAVRKRR